MSPQSEICAVTPKTGNNMFIAAMAAQTEQVRHATDTMRVTRTALGSKAFNHWTFSFSQRETVPGSTPKALAMEL